MSVHSNKVRSTDDRQTTAPKRLRFPLGLSILVVGMTTPLVNQALATVLTAAAQSVATVVSLVVMWVAVLGVWLCLTGDNTSNIRFRLRLSKADVAVAVLVCLGCLVLVPLLSVLVTQWLGTTQVSDTAQRGPVWLIIVGVATAAVTEEVLYRAAPMELLLDSGASQKPRLNNGREMLSNSQDDHPQS